MWDTEIKHYYIWKTYFPLLFIRGEWNAKARSQETLEVTGKFVLGVYNEAGKRQTEFCQENALVIENTLFQQHKRRLYTWTSPDVQHWNQIGYLLCGQRWRSSRQSAKTRPGADYGSDHELLIAKFRLKLKKVREKTRLFRYDLNQIPHNYTVEMRNRFKELNMTGRVPDGDSWHCTGNRYQHHPQKEKSKKWK